jgi:hypothetical protein
MLEHDDILAPRELSLQYNRRIDDSDGEKKDPSAVNRGAFFVHPPPNRAPGALRTAGSGRVSLQHPSGSFYGCYLPVLTGFKRLTSYRTRPSTPLIRRRTRSAKPSGGNSTPVERIPGYRAPLAPRLARFSTVRRCGRPISKWSQPGSNRQPSHCERDALPIELWPQNLRSRGGKNNTGGRVCQAVFKDTRLGQVPKAYKIRPTRSNIIDLALMSYLLSAPDIVRKLPTSIRSPVPFSV